MHVVLTYQILCLKPQSIVHYSDCVVTSSPTPFLQHQTPTANNRETVVLCTRSRGLTSHVTLSRMACLHVRPWEGPRQRHEAHLRTDSRPPGAVRRPLFCPVPGRRYQTMLSGSREWKHTVFVFCVPESNILQVLVCRGRCQNVFPFKGCLIVHRLHTPHRVCLFIH